MLELGPYGCSEQCVFVDFGHHTLLSLTLLIVDPQKNKNRETDGEKTGFITRRLRQLLKLELLEGLLNMYWSFQRDLG